MTQKIKFILLLSTLFLSTGYSSVLMMIDNQYYLMGYQNSNIYLGRCSSRDDPSWANCQDDLVEDKEILFKLKWEDISEWSTEQLRKKIVFNKDQEVELRKLLTRYPGDTVLQAQLNKVLETIQTLEKKKRLSEKAVDMLESKVVFNSTKRNGSFEIPEMQNYVPVFDSFYQVFMHNLLNYWTFLEGKWVSPLPVQPSGEKVSLIYEFWTALNKKKVTAYYEWENGRTSLVSAGSIQDGTIKGTRLILKITPSFSIAISKLNKYLFTEKNSDGDRVFRKEKRP